MPLEGWAAMQTKTRLVPYEMTTPGFEAVYTGGKAENREPFGRAHEELLKRVEGLGLTVREWIDSRRSLSPRQQAG